jgi:ribosomal protein S18 acetylase RimI-like enzyme
MTDVAARAHRNLGDFTRFHARLDPGSVLLDEGGVVAVAGTADFPSARTGVRSDPAVDATECADALVAFFDAHGGGGFTWLRVGADDDLRAELTQRGFHELAQSPEMICDGPLEVREPPPGVSVRFAASAADVTAYARIAGEAFAHLGIPAEVTSTEIDNAEVMLGSDCIIALAEIDGTPVAGALVVLFGAEPTGYVGWVACADAARGKGLGDVVTRAVTNEAFARGAPLVTLEASHFGEHTYARMGYREIYRYLMLIRA